MRWLALGCLVALAACGNKATEGGGGGGSGSGSAAASYQVPGPDAPIGLQLRLSNGTQGAPAVDRTTIAPATSLDDAAVQALLARAPALMGPPTDQTAFALRDKSAPPPKSGTISAQAFPPPPSNLTPPIGDPAAPVHVTQHSPDGAVELATTVSITFDRPMVAVSSQSEAAKTVPATITPAVPGEWRWVGTRTLQFHAKDRFRQSTTYVVDVPAGTKSATGGGLVTHERFNFTTPTLTVEDAYPRGNAERTDTPILLVFDQAIDARSLVTKLAVTADDKRIAIRPLSPQELAKDATLSARIEDLKANGQDGRWLAVRPTATFPTDATIEVTLAAGARSAEGPNPTPEALSHSFRTFPPLSVREARCGYDDCRPGTSFELELTTPLDAKLAPEQHVTVKPVLGNQKIIARGSHISIMGRLEPTTTYEITLAGTLTDGFGQALGQPSVHRFTTKERQPLFHGPGGVVVADPGSTTPAATFYTVGYTGLAVQMYRVQPTDLQAFLAYTTAEYGPRGASPPGTKVFDGVVAITSATPSAIAATEVDLAPGLTNGVGHVVVIATPTPSIEKNRWASPAVSWFEVTKLGLDVMKDASEVRVFATELAAGTPAKDVEVIVTPGNRGTTDATGLVVLPLVEDSPGRASYIVATRGADSVVMPPFSESWSIRGWTKVDPGVQLAWHVFDDRTLYKPGETVSLKGWIRTVDYREGGDIGLLAGAMPTSVTYVVRDPERNELTRGSVPVTALGGFSLTFALPKTVNLGDADVEFTPVGTSRPQLNSSHEFRIEEFRAPEFEVSAETLQGPFVVGGGGDVAVHAKYFAGGPLAGADVNWVLRSEVASFAPPNRDEYRFGVWTPWWRTYDRAPRANRHEMRKSFEARTDGAGTHTLHADFVSVNPPRPMTVTAEATVSDVNRQEWSAVTTLLVHPSNAYVGVKAATSFVAAGTPYEYEVIGVDPEGKALAGNAITVTAARLDWVVEKGEDVEKELDLQTCNVVAAAAPQTCTFLTPKGGRYRVIATIKDAQGRPNETRTTFWVSGGTPKRSRVLSEEFVDIVPDKQTYAAGDTAQLLIQAPFFPAEGIVTWARSGIVKSERITLAQATHVVSVPIEEAMVPNLTVNLQLVGAVPRLDAEGNPDPTQPTRPAYAAGSIDLSIPPLRRALKVSVTPSAEKLAPGSEASVAVRIVDASGAPVPAADVAVVVVDEAILALAGRTFADPISDFYELRGPGLLPTRSRALVSLAVPPDDPGVDRDYDGIADEENDFGVGRSGFGPGGGGTGWGTIGTGRYGTIGHGSGTGSGYGVGGAKAKMKELKPEKAEAAKVAAPGPATTAVAVRTNFNALAIFAPVVTTDAKGAATVALKLPDNLTRYRIVAVAAEGNRFGKGESTLTARLPLMVRPSPPRFANFGDSFQLPVVVQNQTDAPMTVQFAVQTSNLALTAGAGRSVTVPANDRVEVRFPAAIESAGTARFQVIAAAGDVSDAAEISIPVWTPATTEAFATYGTIDAAGSIAQPVKLPGAVVMQYGGLDVTTSSTTLQSLTDAVLYLARYPYECSEQRASRILAIAALRDVMAAFQAPGLPTAPEIATSMATDIQWLVDAQRGDGGWDFWGTTERSYPYLTTFITFALAEAKVKGYAVPASTLDDAKEYLSQIEEGLADYSEEMRVAMSAFALRTRKQLGDLDLEAAKALAASDKLTVEAASWLLATLSGQKSAATERAALLQYLVNRATQTAGTATFVTSYGDGTHVMLASDDRATGIALDALIAEAPTHDLIPKVTAGLLAARKRGRWLNTQENVFALLAMDRYFQAYEKTSPSFVARVWLGDDFAGEAAYRGRSTVSNQISIPMGMVATHDQQALTIAKDGAAGRLYYRIGMTYAPASLVIEPADHGFVVERRYEAVDAPTDVTRLPDGTWKFKAGARVRVQVSLVNEVTRYHVALVDPLPAGLEPLNPELAMTATVDDEAADDERSWWGAWYEHQNMRDDRVEAFAEELTEGVHDLTYVARATTLGTFMVPPPRAEEMYMPETFGRGAATKVVIE